MMTIPADAIKDEVNALIDVQIETFVRPSALTSSELSDYLRRSERLKLLCQELHRIRTRKFFEERDGVAA